MSEKIYLRTFITPTHFCDFDLTYSNYCDFENLSTSLRIFVNSRDFYDFKLTNINSQEKINHNAYHFNNIEKCHDPINVTNQMVRIKTHIQHEAYPTHEVYLTNDDIRNMTLNGKVVYLHVHNKYLVTVGFHRTMSNNFEHTFDEFTIHKFKIKYCFDNIKTMNLDYTNKYDTCCICFNDTCRKTIICHHALCIGCFTQLKKMNANKKLNCPYCRAILY